MVTETDIDADPNGYDRQLDDAQLADFATDINSRVQTLLGQGVPLPMSQIENHHLIGLIEVLVGRAKSLRVREWHLVWVDRQLDEVEGQMRAQLIKSGIFDNAPADVPGFP